MQWACPPYKGTRFLLQFRTLLVNSSTYLTNTIRRLRSGFLKQRGVHLTREGPFHPTWCRRLSLLGLFTPSQPGRGWRWWTIFCRGGGRVDFLGGPLSSIFLFFFLLLPAFLLSQSVPICPSPRAILDPQLLPHLPVAQNLLFTCEQKEQRLQSHVINWDLVANIEPGYKKTKKRGTKYDIPLTVWT